mmetsp:Transcript_14964/g.50632  ORF Transcript_14964/g.50632 Transcript_14964/m.50632 type:complete len:500 (-) Transcript_14964:98-1597(-)
MSPQPLPRPARPGGHGCGSNMQEENDASRVGVRGGRDRGAGARGCGSSARSAAHGGGEGQWAGERGRASGRAGCCAASRKIGLVELLVEPRHARARSEEEQQEHHGGHLPGLVRGGLHVLHARLEGPLRSVHLAVEAVAQLKLHAPHALLHGAVHLGLDRHLQVLDAALGAVLLVLELRRDGADVVPDARHLELHVLLEDPYALPQPPDGLPQLGHVLLVRGFGVQGEAPLAARVGQLLLEGLLAAVGHEGDDVVVVRELPGGGGDANVRAAQPPRGQARQLHRCALSPLPSVGRINGHGERGAVHRHLEPAHVLHGEVATRVGVPHPRITALHVLHHLVEGEGTVVGDNGNVAVLLGGLRVLERVHDDAHAGEAVREAVELPLHVEALLDHPQGHTVAEEGLALAGDSELEHGAGGVHAQRFAAPDGTAPALAVGGHANEELVHLRRAASPPLPCHHAVARAVVRVIGGLKGMQREPRGAGEAQHEHEARQPRHGHAG